MDEIVEGVQTSNQLGKVLTYLGLGHVLRMDVETACYVFKTLLNNQQITRFVDESSTLLKNSEFIPITYDQRVKDYFTSQLLIHSTHNVDHNYAQTIVDMCESFIQQYEFNIDEPKSSLSISFIITQEDYNLAKHTILEILRNFESSDPSNLEGVTILSRENGKIMNIEIDVLSDDALIQINLN